MGRFSLPKAEYKLSEESAEKQVRELLAYYYIDVDAIPDKKERAAVESACAKLVNYFRAGYVEIARDGSKLTVKQHLQDAPGEVAELSYSKMGGRAKLATDGFDADDRYARIYAMLDHLSGSISGTIASLSGVDLSVAEDLGILFLLG